MTNNTEQRRAFEEEYPPPLGVEWVGDGYAARFDKLSDIEIISYGMIWTAWQKAWQAALAQREQEAPSLCTAEEAAELAKGIWRLWDDGDTLNSHDLAKLINADRAKR
jgi:hypothetical protein